MSYLLDTHTFLWMTTNPSLLSVPAKVIIENADNNLYLSIGSVWEIAVKVSLGKLVVPSPFITFVTQQIDVIGISLLAISTEHAAIVATLPFHHRDPFDRLLIAQSMAEKFPVIGKDEVFDRYGVHRIW